MSERVFEGLDGQVRERTKTMLMYFIVFAVTMLFAGFTSAYIVSNMGQFWVHIPAPSMFWVSNVLIVLSSATLWWATRAVKADQTNQGIANSFQYRTLFIKNSKHTRQCLIIRGTTTGAVATGTTVRLNTTTVTGRCVIPDVSS